MGMVIGRLGFCRKKINPDIPIAKATGIPVRRNNINAHMTNSILKIPLTPTLPLPLKGGGVGWG
jgi:hypothetical protein